MQNNHGFHLIELLTTLTIISILAAITLPLYSHHMTKARRLEAITTLAKLSLAMEKYHIENNTFETATLAALHFPDTIAKNNYRLMIKTTSNDYTLIAQPIGKQAENDETCSTLILHANGDNNNCW